MSCPRCCAALFIAVVAFLGLTSCSDAPVAVSSGTAPVPGLAVVSLDAGSLAAGAVLVELRGEGIGAPTIVDAARPMFARALDENGAGAYLVAVAGERVEGALFAFAVPDVNRLDRYTVTLVQVADEANLVQADLSGYRLSVDGSAQAVAGATDVTISN